MENIIVECTTDLTLIENYLSEIVTLLSSLNTKLDILESLFAPGLIQLNGYFYLLIFSLAGVGFFLLMYKFLKIFF
jgi:hypothetical protein